MSGPPIASAFRPPRYGGDVTAPLPSKPRTFDPVAMSNLGEWQLATLLFDGLFRLARQGAVPEAQLARGISTIGNAQRRVVITMRQGLQTHRGAPVGASDAVASLRRLIGSSSGWLLGTVAGVTALDGHRLELRLHRPCPELTAVLSAPQASILPRGLPPGPSPDGTGAFRHSRGRLQEGIRLSAHAAHVSGRPYLDTLTLVPYSRRHDEVSAFYLRRSLLSFHGARLFGRAPGFATRVLESPAVTTVALLAGQEGATRDLRVRQAISLAIDKQRLRQLVTQDPTTAAHGPVPPVLLGKRAQGLAKEPAPFDPARARALLTEAQSAGRVPFRRSSDGGLALVLLVDRTSHRDMDIARKLMADLGAVGLRVTITGLEPAELATRRHRGSFELALHKFTSPVLQSRYHLAAAYAAAGLPKEALRVVRDLRARVNRRNQGFMEKLPLIPLYHTGVRVELSPNVAVLKQGPWGLLDWAGAQVP
ncbi:MAG: ABC transporter substrate-binding protein [Polyangia bacterium]|nr:ABC transporter substrate-binding protein [Polyangia bacterium]